MYAKRFQEGITRANSLHHSIYNHKVRGEGRTAHYVCAAKPTLEVLERMQKFDDVRYTPRMATEKVKLLRSSWEVFMTDPSEYVNGLLEVIPRDVHRNVMCIFRTDICMFL
jgi:hypothetical protein